MLKKSIIGLFILLLYSQIAVSQNFINKTKDEVKQLMKEHKKEFHVDKSSKNPYYNMLKYVDRLGNQTLLYVFDENDICRYSQLMCDYSILNRTIDQLDQSYTKKSDTLWYYTEAEESYQVILKKEEWFFSVLTKKEDAH